MADKENDDLEQSLKNMGFSFDNKDLNSLLADDGNKEALPATKTDADAEEENLIDFNDFSIDDLDTALKQYDVSADSLLSDENNTPAVSAAPQNETVVPMPQESPVIAAEPAQSSVDDTSSPEPLTFVESPTWERRDTLGQQPESVVGKKEAENNEAATIAARGFFSDKEIQEAGNLRWYDGNPGEKVYEISLTNMPEFLDYNPQIKTIHVNIDSPYGWNVFFENGTFMNLMDLKVFQERNGHLPGANGKIIYGSKTSSFEGIERIVVYEKPRYFFYGIKK